MAEPTNKGEGAAIRFIRDHERYPHKEWCLIWPFSTTRGYGTFGYLGKGYYAHRFMCELAEEYGVSESCISNVWTGKTHYRPSKIVYWTEAEVQQVRDGVAAGKDFVQIAKEMGRKHHDVSSKAYRLGLRSGKPCSNFGKASSRLPSDH